MRVFLAEFLTTAFLNNEISHPFLAYIIYNEILDKANLKNEEVDLFYFFGTKEKNLKGILKKNPGKVLILQNSLISLTSAFVSAIEYLKTNKIKSAVFISINEKKKMNPFIKEKNNYLIEAKKFGIKKSYLDEVLMKSYFQYEQFISKKNAERAFQPIFLNGKIFYEDNFFKKGISRDLLALSNLKSNYPWEIFSDYHFAESACGACAILMLNEDFLKERNFKNILEISFFDYVRNKKNKIEGIMEKFLNLKEKSLRTAFVSTPCIIDEAIWKIISFDQKIQKEYFGFQIQIDEINPCGSDIFWGWTDGTGFLRRLGFLKVYMEGRAGRAIIYEKIPKGPDFFIEFFNL